MKKSLIIMLMVTMMLVFVFTGCQTQAPDTKAEEPAAEEPAAEEPAAEEPAAEEPAADEKIVIALSVMNSVEPFYKDMEDGVVDACEEMGAEYVLTSAEGDLAKQISQTEDFITNKVSAMILAPADSDGIVPAVLKANEAGIPFIAADINANGGELGTFVASNNAIGGTLAAEFIADQIGEGQVLILDDQKITSVLHRSDAFVEAVENDYPGLEIVERTNVGFARDANMKVVEDLMITYPDLKAVFAAMGGDAGLGAEAAIKAAGKSDDIIVVNFDALPDSLEAIKNGTAIKADVAQNPYQIGYQACMAAIKIVNGETVESFIEIPVELMTIDNIE